MGDFYEDNPKKTTATKVVEVALPVVFFLGLVYLTARFWKKGEKSA